MDIVSRRLFMAQGSLAAASALLLPRLLLAQGSGDQERIAAELLKPVTQQSIDRGLAWLGGRQTEEGGFKSSGFGRNAAGVSLSGMAFLAGGNTPGRGEYGQHVNRCISYILKAADDSGFISLREYTSHGPMYDPGFATLFLAEVYGMTPDSEVREKLESAVK